MEFWQVTALYIILGLVAVGFFGERAAPIFIGLLIILLLSRLIYIAALMLALQSKLAAALEVQP